MPMKISLALGARRILSRQTAWGCLTSNLALPGSGSLVAGFRAGYAQAALSTIGLILTSIFGIRFIIWSLSNWNRLHGIDADPINALGEMWVAIRSALLGMVLFIFGWVWALATSLVILRSAAPDSSSENLPPRLHQD